MEEHLFKVGFLISCDSILAYSLTTTVILAYIAYKAYIVYKSDSHK